MLFVVVFVCFFVVVEMLEFLQKSYENYKKRKTTDQYMKSVVCGSLISNELPTGHFRFFPIS